MSRDFKQEYEQYMRNETPDLWARIETNLSVKEAPVIENPTAEVATVSKVVSMKQRKGMSRRRMTYGMTAAAALLICVLAVPVLREAQGGSADSANYAFMAKDAAMPEMVMEAGGADAGAMDNGMKYGAEKATETEKAAGTETAPTPLPDTAESKVAVFIAEVTILERFEQDGKVLYRADITGREVILALGETLSETAILSVGEVYELSLETVDGEATWDYVIVGM